MSKRTDFARLADEAKDEQGWTRADIAAALGVAEYTVDAWMRPSDNAASRDAPAWAGIALQALITGQPTYELRGELEIKYDRARPSRRKGV